MNREEFAAALGREPAATDQPTGTYKYRAMRDAPWQPVRIIHDEQGWWCFKCGELLNKRPRPDPDLIPFINIHGPFGEISWAEYMAMMKDYAAAGPGSPLKTPYKPVK